MRIFNAKLTEIRPSEDYDILVLKTSKGYPIYLRDYAKKYDTTYIGLYVPFYYIKDGKMFYPRLAYFVYDEVDC